MSTADELNVWLVIAADSWQTYYHVRRGVPQSTVDEALDYFRQKTATTTVWRCIPYCDPPYDHYAYDRTIQYAKLDEAGGPLFGVWTHDASHHLRRLDPPHV